MQPLLQKWDGQPVSKALNLQLICILAVGAVPLPPVCHAGEGPFFITYTHQMEEPHNLELTTTNVTGRPGAADRFLGTATELDSGVTGWWTTEFILTASRPRRRMPSLPDIAGRTGFICWRARIGLIPCSPSNS